MKISKTWRLEMDLVNDMNIKLSYGDNNYGNDIEN